MNLNETNDEEILPVKPDTQQLLNAVTKAYIVRRTKEQLKTHSTSVPDLFNSHSFPQKAQPNCPINRKDQPKMFNLYVASHIDQAPYLLSIRAGLRNNPKQQIDFCSSWIDNADKPDLSAYARVFWERDLLEVTTADALVVWTSKEKVPLRGALVEVGAALSDNKPIICVGKHFSFGTWQHHRNVCALPSWEETFEFIRYKWLGA